MSTKDHPDWWRPVGGSNAQDSTLERRSLIWNDDGIEDGTVPAVFFTQATNRGKFFTRGCRGMMEQIQLYCIGDGVDTITLRYSPHPCIGPLGEVVITPAAAWAWQPFDVEQMWNYDSLFIWVHECEAAVVWTYDATLPYDGHRSLDAGATWEDTGTRPFIRAVMTGETPGDVPVSGIINNIPIPSVAGAVEAGDLVNVPHGVDTDILTMHGAGTLTELYMMFHTSVAPTEGLLAVVYRIDLYADGGFCFRIGNRELTQSQTLRVGRNTIGEFWQTFTAYDRTFIRIRPPVEFRRSLRVVAYQSSGAATNVAGGVFANMKS